MKMSPVFLFSVVAGLIGLMLGGAAAWLLPVRESQRPAFTDASARSGLTAVRDASPEDKPLLKNRRALLLRLLNASVRSGGSSMAEAWKEAAGDPAMRAWLAEVWLREDPAAFIRMIFDSGDGLSMGAEGMMLISLGTQFAERDPQTAMRIGPTLPPSAGRWIMSQAILKIMESNVSEGLALAAKHPELRLNGNMDLDKIKVTGADIPALLSLPRAMMVDMLMGKATNDLPPADAMKLSSQMHQVTRRSVMASVSKGWVKNDLDGALAFAHNEATDQQRVSILTAVGEKKVEENPAAAAGWALENLGGNARNRILQKAAEKLEKTDPTAAETIRARLPQNYNPKAK